LAAKSLTPLGGLYNIQDVLRCHQTRTRSSSLAQG